MDCTKIDNHCLACNGQGGWKGITNAKFPQTPSDYNNYQTNVIGGIANSKNFRTYASSFTILKKALTTYQPNTGSNPSKSTLPNIIEYGPGDAVASIPIRTGTASGIKARLIVQPSQTGVDVKHGSYERYLARKRGVNMRCQNC